MRRIALLGLLLPLFFAAALDAYAAAPVRSAQDIADLKRVSAYLDTLKSVEGHFLQVAANGKSDQGTFYLKKPGRARFEYQKPNPNLIVSDGTTVAVINSSLKTTDRYPLVNSPLRLLLSEGADLASDPRIGAVMREPGALGVTARETSGPAQGSITLTFAHSGQGGGLELRQWDITDAQGAHTMVVVKDMHQVADIPAKLFIIEDLSPFQRR